MLKDGDWHLEAERHGVATCSLYMFPEWNISHVLATVTTSGSQPAYRGLQPPTRRQEAFLEALMGGSLNDTPFSSLSRIINSLPLRRFLWETG